MYTRNSFVQCKVYFAGAALLLAAGAIPARAQQGIVMDWSTHHVVFANPGSEMDAIMNGRRQQWEDLVNNPRYRMQQVRRSGAWAARLTTTSALAKSLQRDAMGESGGAVGGLWTEPIGPTGSGTAPDMYPAFFASSFTTTSCSDYIVFPVNTGGKSGTGTGQANFVGFNNLYSGTCTGTVPMVAFAFYVGQGTFQTSPVPSLDGTKIALIESNNSTKGTRTNFHVLTLGTNGTGNGGPYNSPAVPHTIINNGVTKTTTATNNATDAYVSLVGNPSITRSSPYVDYTNDVAYIGDDKGRLHKITGVFTGTPTEVSGSGWPANVKPNAILTGPILDGLTGNILVGASNGALYCVVSTTGSPCSNPSRSVSGASTAGTVLDAPVVASDGTNSWVFSEANGTSGSTSEAVLMQSDTNLTSASVVRANMGEAGTDLYNGDFDNTYYSSNPGAYSGYMYFCGNLSGAATPALYRIGFNSAGTMNSANDGNSLQLVASGNRGTTVDCTPLTEVYNGTTDMLFLGVKGSGNPSGCAGDACIMSFTLGTSFPSAPAAEYSLVGNGNGSSGLVIDNTSTQAGASQIYFSNLQSDHSATQLSQSGLN